MDELNFGEFRSPRHALRAGGMHAQELPPDGIPDLLYNGDTGGQ